MKRIARRFAAGLTPPEAIALAGDDRRLRIILTEPVRLRNLSIADYRYQLYEPIDAATLDVGREIDKAPISVH
jgi:hypothetical protein